MPLTREERKLLHQKSKQPTLGVGSPDNQEGYDGDISFRQIEGSGTVEYVKQSNEWVAVASSGEMPPVRIIGGTRGSAVGTGSGITSHGALSGLGDDDHTTYILVDGTRAFTGQAMVDDTTEATSTTDGSLQTDGGLSVVKDAIFGNDVKLLTDASVFSMGVGNDFTFTHDNTTGGTIAGNPVTITSGGAATWSTSAGNLTVDAAAAVLVLDGHTGITLDASNSGNIEINVTAADDILIGNDAVAQDILIGNAAATQVDLTAILVDINGGSSGVTIDGDVNINSYALTNSDPYTVSIKPNNSTQHMTMGLADKQNNYSMIGIYSAAAAAIPGVSADDWSWDT